MGERIIHPKFNVHENYTRVNIINPYRFGGGTAPVGYEPETLALMASIGWADDDTPSPHNGLTYSGVYAAVDNYFKAGKSGGWLSLMKAVYLFLGNNSGTHKWNAVNPQDTNAAFRIQWFGASTFTASGFQGNGTTGHGRTFYSPAANVTLNSEHLSFYCTTNNTNIKSEPIDMGTVVSGSSRSTLYSKNVNNFGSGLNGVSVVISNTDSRGFYIATKNGNTTLNLYKNGISVQSGTSAGSLPNVDVFIGTISLGNSTTAYLEGFTTQNYAYASMGSGLSAAQALSHYNAVHQLQTDLGRQV